MNYSVEKRVKRLEVWNKLMVFIFAGSFLILVNKGCGSDTSRQTLRIL